MASIVSGRVQPENTSVGRALLCNGPLMVSYTLDSSLLIPLINNKNKIVDSLPSAAHLEKRCIPTIIYTSRVK